MVSGISSLNMSNLNIVAEKQASLEKLKAQQKECEDKLKEYKDSLSFSVSKESIFSSCSASTLDEYISNRTGGSLLGLTEDDYKAEFQEYMQSRGCSSEAELKAVNSSNLCMGHITKNELLQYAEITLSQASGTLFSAGLSGTNLTQDDLKSLVSSMSLQDLADLTNNYDKASNVYEQTSVFKKFIDNAATSSSLTDELKSKLASISQDIVNSDADIMAFSDKIEKECEAQRAESNARIAAQNAALLESSSQSQNVQKYTASLISNYQN